MDKKTRSFSELAALYANIGKLITASVEFQYILEGIMKEVRQYFRPQNWSMLRYDQITRKLYFAIIEGEDLSKYQEFRLSLGEGIAGYVAQTRKPLLVQDAYSDPRFNTKIDQKTGFRTDSIIAVPCMTREKLYGVFELVNHEGIEKFTEDDLYILQSIADFSAIAFANAETYEHALLQSMLDPLTGLWNHSKLNELIRSSGGTGLHRRKQDESVALIVAFIDLDDFKSINDTYGHTKGDEVLKDMAAKIAAAFRRDDVVIRSGGDEFIAVVETNAASCRSLRDTIESRLSAIRYENTELGVSVGLSFGLSDGPAGDIRQLIKQADEAMYSQKNA